ncbi:fibronectin type III domain-containing protein [Agathobacter rectalis]|uniref:Protein tyrosine phosphatase, receptor type, J n=2 Tax=Agathobacter rectalis TaxID=39491 RepID=C4ZHK5_AGARV|nr:fibronectin type III domain-containing protein [Agathobacter rectalis]ACR76492.1 protein tyrosine phosphatase, receptor type, J [Agathobacter rectalis ATCC 33656]UML64643.1 fibronectin type III domain-containing protein [Agathobacter rectalis]
MKKKIIATLLSLAIVMSGSFSAFAADFSENSESTGVDSVTSMEESSESNKSAEELISDETISQDDIIGGSEIKDTASNQLDVENTGEAKDVEVQLNDGNSVDIMPSNSVEDEEINTESSVKTYASDSESASQSIFVNKKNYGELSKSDEVDNYKFTLSSAGSVRIDFGKEYEDSNRGWTVEVYNSNWEIIKRDEFRCGNSKTDSSSVLGLASGTYYLRIKGIRWEWTDTKYNFTLVYSASNSWEKEANNSFSTATKVNTNSVCYGSISNSDSTDIDYYKFSMANAGHIRIDFGKEYDSNADHGWNVILYNSEQEKYIEWTFNCGNSKTDSTCEYGLPKGTYYILIKPIDYDDTSVTYNFNINFSSSAVWEKELNDDLATPNLMNVNTTYYGTTTSWNEDCYKFTLKKNGTVSIDFGKAYDKDTSHGWDVRLYNTDREEVSKGDVYCGDTNIKSVISTDLVAGSYYLKVSPKAYDVSEVVYNIKVTAKNEPAPAQSTVSAVSGLKIGGRAGDALRLNWNKNTSADGYIVEQYKSGSWTRIARIGSNSTVTYRVEKLSPSTKYNFRVKAFKLNGNAATYSSYKNISGITNPATISGLKIGGHAADALRLNWTKNSKASGYIVEQYKGGKWTRIARIGENSTTTYRVEKLSASTTYKFRVQAFGFDGKTALYGNYAYINGKTSPATVTGIRIGGTAKDALRVNWNKDSKASGYIVQQYKNGTWVRIARIGNNNTTTYRVSGLKSGSTYIFRVQAFGYDGKTAIYGGFAMIPGTTK